MTGTTQVHKRVLSIDGGGFRSYACLVTINYLMKQLRSNNVSPRPCEVFDMICGTSTGGLIAILLGRLGLDCLTAMSVYYQLTTKLFAAPVDKDSDSDPGSEGVSSDAFNRKVAEIVERYTGDKAALMKISKTRPDKVNHTTADTFVTVVQSTAGAAGVEPYRLRSYATPRGGVESIPDYEWTICDAIRAATALPGYSKPTHVGPHSFQDASLSGVASPIWEAILEVELRWSKGCEPLVVSVGTGLVSLCPLDPEEELSDGDSMAAAVVSQADMHPVAKSQQSGGRSWLDVLSGQLVRVARDTEVAHRRVARRFKKLNLGDNYLRFDPAGGLGDLSTTNTATIVAYTNTWLRTPECAKVTTSARRALMKKSQ